MSKLGAMVGSAETFMSFMGGNRSFPAAGNMDDRRHRLNGLEKGENGQYATQGMMQQHQMSTDGQFMTTPNDKTMRMAVIDDSSQQDQSSQSFQQQAAMSDKDSLLEMIRDNKGGFLPRDKQGFLLHTDREGRVHRFRRVFPPHITNYTRRSAIQHASRIQN